MTTIADLFDPVPEQWGLRGDPYLWREMQASFADTVLPETGTEFRAELIASSSNWSVFPFRMIVKCTSLIATQKVECRAARFLFGFGPEKPSAYSHFDLQTRQGENV
ncbi:hypothetical protein SH528x_002932 [Novipirellula sp. SH528]|uniref:hypothetical protein n=1 Tax=Novipirellula sp. SH528 TaxID=3454466 RepID=UPI003F9FAD21